MNERIEELRKQASDYASRKSSVAEEWKWIWEQKFTELLIRDVLGVINDEAQQCDIDTEDRAVLIKTATKLLTLTRICNSISMRYGIDGSTEPQE